MAGPSNKQIKSSPLVGNQSKTPSYLQFNLFHFIYPHKEAYIVISKVESENIACIVPHENPLLFGSHLWFSGIHLSTWIVSAFKHLGECLRSGRRHLIALRVLALLNTPLVLLYFKHLRFAASKLGDSIRLTYWRSWVWAFLSFKILKAIF